MVKAFVVTRPTLEEVVLISCEYQNTLNKDNLFQRIVRTEWSRETDGAHKLILFVEEGQQYYLAPAAFVYYGQPVEEGQKVYIAKPVDWTPLGELVEL